MVTPAAALVAVEAGLAPQETYGAQLVDVTVMVDVTFDAHKVALAVQLVTLIVVVDVSRD